MKQLFHIYNPDPEGDESNVLLAEVGEDYCAFAKCNAEKRLINELEYHTFSKFNFAEDIASLFESMKKEGSHFNTVAFCVSFPQALLTPLQLYKEETEEELLRSVYDLTGTKILQDAVEERELLNVYAIPQPLYQLTASQFSAFSFTHVYTTLIKLSEEHSFSDQLILSFTTTGFQVMVQREQQLMLAQTFSYTTPLDVLYTLLKISSELSLNQKEVHVILGGLIEEESALYKELARYFLHLHLVKPSSLHLLKQQYPPHFFSSLYNLAACVL